MNLEQNINNAQENTLPSESVQEVASVEVLSEEDKQAKVEEKAQKEKENNEEIEKVKEDILKQFKIEDKETANKIKKGVDFVFEQNPELIKIGTKEQYSEYLDTIFPDSKVKDIVYHASPNKFSEFKVFLKTTFFFAWIFVRKIKYIETK